MGWAGACGDDSGMESFFGLLQKNALDGRRWGTCGQLRLAIIIWIKRTYYWRLRQRHLGKLTDRLRDALNHRHARGLTHPSGESGKAGSVPTGTFSDRAAPSTDQKAADSVSPSAGHSERLGASQWPGSSLMP
jgi:hypothetical protein